MRTNINKEAATCESAELLIDEVNDVRADRVREDGGVGHCEWEHKEYEMRFTCLVIPHETLLATLGAFRAVGGWGPVSGGQKGCRLAKGTTL